MRGHGAEKITLAEAAEILRADRDALVDIDLLRLDPEFAQGIGIRLEDIQQRAAERDYTDWFHGRMT